MKLLSAVVCAVLVAGAYAATPVNRDVDSFYAFTVTAHGQTIQSCRLTIPGGQALDFTPGIASQHGERYQLQPILEFMPSCSVLVNNLQTSDNGLWEITLINTEGAQLSERYQLTVGTELQESEEAEEVNPEENKPEENESEEAGGINEVENIRWLHTIEFPTRINKIIDISLPRSTYEEECIIRTPDQRHIEASKAEGTDGFRVFEKSDFVSCRIIIGPIIEKMLGEWALCGKYIENGEEHQRCQPVKIYWNTPNLPATDWHFNVQAKFNHPVHFESELSPAVIGHGDVVTCHVVTPNGEDLVIRPGADQDTSYPYIRASSDHSTSICSFTIGPIHRGLLGNWVVYGLFRSHVVGLNEERLPFNMFLYDEENPTKQAYNVTVNDPVTRAANLGDTEYLEVSTSVGQVDRCSFTTPDGHLYVMGYDNDFEGASFLESHGIIACRVAIGPITKALMGDWKIIGKFSNNGIFTERQQVFHLVQEDPVNPIPTDREITYLNAENVHSEMGRSYRFIIPSHDFTYGESCHIRTPDGLQHEIIKGINTIPGLELIEEYGVECGVIVTLVSEDIVGEWTLIARAKQYSKPIERRLPFNIFVTETVEALQNSITLVEGDDLYVSLKNPTVHHETCKLIGPYGFECPSAVKDPQQVETCGFIRRDVQTFNSGTWTITSGNKINYKAEIAVTVNAETADTTPVPISESTMTMVRDRSIDQDVGPENAIYCRLEDPQGITVFDGFGRCHLVLDRVGLEHHGTWRMQVATSGKILTDEHVINVNVRESEGKPVVTTAVTQAKPIVTVSCSVQSNTAIIGCKFRNPHGKILISTPGLTEDRYTFFGRGSSYDSGVWTHECGIQITDPITADLGLWRCAIQSQEETYFGHMPVLCPWALSDPATAAIVQQEPILRATHSLVNVVEADPATMSCAVESVIRYCYFRAANGTIFTVTPDMKSSTMEYTGAGFDAGECGIRFTGMNAPDSGRWSCHVGLVDVAEEQRDQFQVTVHERMRVNHFTSQGNVMTVEGIVHEGRALEYCRFVRIDGFGFTTDSMPSQYTLTGILANGECQFTARDPTILDLHPWTVAARIRGQDIEISKDTMESVIIGAPESPEAGPEDNPGHIIIYRNNGLTIFMYMFLSFLLLTIIFGGLFGPKKNRQWTAQRASAFRRSVSNSFKRQQREPAPTYTP